MTAPARTFLPQAFFLSNVTGQRFCLLHPAQGSVQRGRVLYLHPFAEELNTTRRIAAQQARALAQAGFTVLQIDMQGCGDSSGDFADATWSAWLDDAEHGYRWLLKHTSGPMWIWGMRSGALLAAELVQRRPQLQGAASEPIHLLFWQPVASGAQMLQQFLRLHSASQWLGSGNNHGPSPAQQLAQGEPVAIAGYTLSPALAQGLGDARLHPPAGASPGRLVWLEMSSQPVPTLSPAAAQSLDVWRAAGWQVHAHTVTGPAFWQTVGIDAAPALLHATQQALTASQPARHSAATP